MTDARGPAPVGAGDLVELELTDLAWGGAGVGRTPDGFVVFVEGGLAGERVRARIRRVRRGHAEAGCEAVLRPSPDRSVPPCRHYGACGGCDLQHLGLAAQSAMRRGQVAALLERIAGCEPETIAPTIVVEGSGPYRFRMDFDRGPGPDGTPVLGLHRRGEPAVLEPVPDCLILPEAGNRVREGIEAALGAREIPIAVKRVSIQVTPEAAEILITLALDVAPGPAMRALAVDLMAGFPVVVGVVGTWSPVAEGRPRFLTLAGRDFLEVEVDGDRLRVPAGAFFQPNVRGWSILRKLAIDLLDPQAADRVLELYCGVGFFTLPLARRAADVVAVEGMRSAVAATRDALARHGLTNTRLVGREVAGVLPALLRDREFDSVLVDPPRAGLADRSARLLSEARIRRIVYVSCDPGTLARDLKTLVSTGGFRVTRVVPIDLFPHTHHVECVAQLDR